MADKTLTHLGAMPQTEDRFSRRTGLVEFRAIPAWVKDSKYVTAELTPSEARKLAIELLTAAERAEEAV